MKSRIGASGIERMRRLSSPLNWPAKLYGRTGESDGNSLVHTAESGGSESGSGEVPCVEPPITAKMSTPARVAGQSTHSGQLLRSAIDDDELASRGETYAVSRRSPPAVVPFGMAVQIVRWLKVTAPPWSERPRRV
jgi:hypothetical protein